MPRRDVGSRDDYFDRLVPGPAAQSWGFGKVDFDMPAGILPEPADEYEDDVRIVSIWKGPRHSDDADTGRDITAHYSKYELTAGTYVSWTRHSDGGVYVMPWDCPEEDEG